MDTEQDTTSSTEGDQIIFEFTVDDHIPIIQKDTENPDSSDLVRLLEAIFSTLPQEDKAKTRIIITADFEKSVTSRLPDSSQPYTIERGSGVVAGKTMRISGSDIVDIIFPLYLLVPQEDSAAEAETYAHIDHVGKHEAVHAHLRHLHTEPFGTNHREEFGVAMRQFVAMASEQAEEYLAELVATEGSLRVTWASAESIDAALVSLEDALETQLLAIPRDAEDYYGKAMFVTFNSFHILWKTLAFLAAELQADNVFKPLPEEIAKLELWDEYVAPWWEEYSGLLGKIPMSLDIDIAQTDEIVKDIAELLQQWSLELGYDFHDTPEGEGWFQWR